MDQVRNLLVLCEAKAESHRHKYLRARCICTGWRIANTITNATSLSLMAMTTTHPPLVVPALVAGCSCFASLQLYAQCGLQNRLSAELHIAGLYQVVARDINLFINRADRQPLAAAAPANGQQMHNPQAAQAAQRNLFPRPADLEEFLSQTRRSIEFIEGKVLML